MGSYGTIPDTHSRLCGAHTISNPVYIHLVTGGKYHDFNPARLVLLNLMAEDERIRARCSDDFRDVDNLAGFAAIVLYTCDLMPSDEEAQALANFVAEGGKLFALHGANAGLEFTDGPEIVASGVRIPGLVKPTAGSVAPAFMDLLGSRFVAHLAGQALHIHVEDADHPITAGLEDFTVNDEPNIATPLAEYRTLLPARYSLSPPQPAFPDITTLRTSADWLGYRPPASEVATPPWLPSGSASLHLRATMAPEAILH